MMMSYLHCQHFHLNFAKQDSLNYKYMYCTSKIMIFETIVD